MHRDGIFGMVYTHRLGVCWGELKTWVLGCYAVESPEHKWWVFAPECSSVPSQVSLRWAAAPAHQYVFWDVSFHSLWCLSWLLPERDEIR